jgi:hypothetical protein
MMTRGSTTHLEAHRLLERAHQLLSSGPPPLDDLLTMGGWLFDQALEEGEAPQELGSGVESTRKQLLETARVLRHEAVQCALEQGPGAIAGLVGQRLVDLERKQRELYRDATRPPREVLTGFLGLESRLYTLHLLLEAARGTQRDWILADASRLGVWIERQTQRAESQTQALGGRTDDPDHAAPGLDSLQLAGLFDRVAELRHSIAEARHSGLLRKAEDLRGVERLDPLDRFELLLEIGATRSGSAPPSATGSPDASIRSQASAKIEDGLRKQIESDLKGAGDGAHADSYCQMLRRLDERIEETLGTVESRPTNDAIELLEELARQISWLEGVGLRLGLDAGRGTDLRQRQADLERRRLRRKSRSVQDALLERRLQARLSRLLGAARFDAIRRGTFLLILVLTVILSLDLALDLNRQMRRVVDIADAAICTVLLTEMAVAIALSRRPLRFLRRHWLFDVLPAIPFGFLEGWMTPSWAIHSVAYARPMLWIGRLGILLLRGMDRVAWRYRALLQPNLVVFEPPPTQSDDRPDVMVLVSRIRAKNLLRMRFVCRSVKWRDLGPLLETVLDDLQGRVQLATASGATASGFSPLQHEIRFEALVEQLEQLRPEEVEDILGGETTRRVAFFLRLLNVPVIRSFPLVRGLVARNPGESAAEAVANAGRALGRTAGGAVRLVHWFSDLKGLVTGPALLDRIGFFLVGYTQRPAKRLLFFGFVFLVLKFMLDLLLLRLRPLESVAGLLSRTLGLGLIVIGTVCLAIMGVGLWLRRIAGEATDVYRNLVEAQHSNLLETEKEATRDRDLKLVDQRVLLPEASIRPDFESCMTASCGLERLFRPGLVRALDASGAALLDLERIGRLHRDFLDGSVLHQSNTKVVEQLLGNLVLLGVRLERLAYRREELKRLDRLEFKGGRAWFGPHLWFRLSTTSLAEQTAKLILEFNRYCIPLEERQRAQPEDLDAMQRWLARLWGRAAGAARREVDRERRRVEHFQTTAFHALHFLSDERSRDAEIEQEFGEEIRRSLQHARKTMIRRIFGSHALHTLPRQTRTLNLYGIYRRRLAGGRVLLLPLSVTFGVLGWIPKLFRLVASAIHDILDPTFLPESVDTADASLSSARRKIDRMRRPIFLETMRLRAEFDPEYLGIALPGLPHPPAGFATCEDDLDFIDASGAERDLFNQLRRRRREASQRLLQALVGAGLLLELGPGLLSLAPTLTSEGLRAACIAWLIDYRGVARLLDIEQQIDSLLADPSLRNAPPWRTRLRLGMARLVRMRVFLRPDPFEQSFARYEAARGWSGLASEERRIRQLAYRLDQGGVRGRIDEVLDRGVPGRAAEEGRRLLAEIAAYPGTWSTQVLTVRTVQVLAVLDLMHLRETVEALGRYREDVPEARQPVEPASPEELFLASGSQGALRF